MGRRETPGAGGLGESTGGTTTASVEKERLEQGLECNAPLKPELCRDYVRKRLAEGFPQIVDTFMDRATEGSVPHAKALAALAGFDQRPMESEQLEGRGRGSSVIRRILKEMRAVRLARLNAETSSSNPQQSGPELQSEAQSTK
jgi:hypothetical protein